jgi:hypothetical protein
MPKLSSPLPAARMLLALFIGSGNTGHILSLLIPKLNKLQPPVKTGSLGLKVIYHDDTKLDPR